MFYVIKSKKNNCYFKESCEGGIYVPIITDHDVSFGAIPELFYEHWVEDIKHYDIDKIAELFDGHVIGQLEFRRFVFKIEDPDKEMK